MAIVVSPTRAIELNGLGYQNNPFVVWQNLGASAALSGSSVIAGGERANAVTGSTYDKWRTVTGTTAREIIFDFGVVKPISFAALAASNLSEIGGSVSVNLSTNGTTWVDSGAGSVTPTDKSPIAWRFADASWRWARFLFVGLPTDKSLNAGIAFLGHETIIPRRLYQGFAPVLTPTEVQLQSNVSIGGDLLGSSVIGRGSRLSADISHVDAEFIRSAEWLAFQRSFGEGKGFFFGWRPDKYPQDIHYCARDGDVIRPSNSGPKDMMNINFSARVYANG